MAHHKHISSHGREVVNGVQQRLALAGRAARDVQIEHIGRQTLGRNFKRGACARAVFKEQVKHALATQQRYFFDFAVVDADEVAGRIQNLRENVFGQTFSGEQVNQLAVLVQLGVALVQHV